jgi:hypothetical protein
MSVGFDKTGMKLFYLKYSVEIVDKEIIIF